MSARIVERTEVGQGFSSCHHGEILQGIFRGPEGEVRRGLVTLPMPGLGSRATFAPNAARELAVAPAGRTKALRAASLTLDLLAEERRGRLTLAGDIPVGLGMGSSTSDIIATIRAVAMSCGAELAPEAVARLAVGAESASDPLMLDDRPVLFAQREGAVLEVLGNALPAMSVVGCTTGGGTSVDTVAMPAPGHDDLPFFEGLRDSLRRAVTTADVGLLGRVCTESARRNQRVLAKDEFGVLEEVARTVGASGVQVAHSGNVAAVLFDPGQLGLPHRVRDCVHALRGNGIEVSRIFRTDVSSTVESVNSPPVSDSTPTCPFQGVRPCTSTSQTHSAARPSCACRKD